jgi:hypothetical protein
MKRPGSFRTGTGTWTTTGVRPVATAQMAGWVAEWPRLVEKWLGTIGMISKYALP